MCPSQRQRRIRNVVSHLDTCGRNNSGSGGPKIITAVTSIFLNHIILGMPLFEATIHPRVHDQLIYHGAAVTNVEETQLVTGEPIIIDNRTVNALQRRHHGVLKIDYTGTVQSVSVDLETNTLR